MSGLQRSSRQRHACFRIIFLNLSQPVRDTPWAQRHCSEPVGTATPPWRRCTPLDRFEGSSRESFFRAPPLLRIVAPHFRLLVETQLFKRGLKGLDPVHISCRPRRDWRVRVCRQCPGCGSSEPGIQQARTHSDSTSSTIASSRRPPTYVVGRLDWPNDLSNNRIIVSRRSARSGDLL